MTNGDIIKIIEQNLPEYNDEPICEDELFDLVHKLFPTLDYESFSGILNGMVRVNEVRCVPFKIGEMPKYTKLGIAKLPPNQNPNLNRF